MPTFQHGDYRGFRKFSFPKCLVPYCLLLVAIPATAKDITPEELLQKVLRAQPKLRFSGTRKIETIVRGERIRLNEYILRSGMRLRITYPEDSPRHGFVVIQNGKERLEYNPHTNQILRTVPKRLELLERLGHLREAAKNKRITVRVFDSEPIANRPTHGLLIADKQGNIAQKYWIDKETGLILKAVLFDKSGAEHASFEFVHVNYNPIIKESDFQLRINAPRIEPRNPRPEFRALAPTWLPEGFREVERRVRMHEKRQILMIHFSDGVHHVSLFQSPGKELPPLPPGASRQGVNIRRTNRNSLWVVAIGNLKPETLDRIILSLR
ncbi:MAG TPA: MucB/RseB C-terminal domain-containing protein [Fimbriimonadales bacterium]|nr:MucB/RseB C-terminal domain-containing protein [Fimbriimonadales bacterium]